MTDITDEYLNWLNDKDHLKYSEQRLTHHTRESSIKFLDSFDFQNDFFFAIRYSNNLIGTATVRKDESTDSHWLGILVERNYSGKGHGKEAWIELVNSVLPRMGIEKLSGGTHKLNRSMQRLFLASGFNEIQDPRAASDPDVFKDWVIYSRRPS